MYYSKYDVFTSNIMYCMCLGTWESVDGSCSSLLCPNSSLLSLYLTFHPIAFSTPSPCSPPPCLLHLLSFHLLIFSISSSRSTPPCCSLHPVAVLRHLLVFPTSSSSSPPPPHLYHLLVAFFTTSLSSPLRRHVFHVVVVPSSALLDWIARRHFASSFGFSSRLVVG